MPDRKSRRAKVEDVHELALAMPHTTVERGSGDNPVYQVGGKSFVFFRNPRPDAVDPDTGERYPDVIVFWVGSEADKQAMVQDEGSPFFTTPHFNGHPSVLLRAARVGELSRRSWRKWFRKRGCPALRRAARRRGSRSTRWTDRPGHRGQCRGSWSRRSSRSCKDGTTCCPAP